MKRAMTTDEWRVKALAKELGAILDTENGEVNVEAPRGYTWRCDPSVHELVNSPADAETQRDMWSMALARMSAGIEPCPLGDSCEWCRQ